MTISYNEIDNAFEFVSSGPPFEQTALLDKVTGKIYYASDLSGINEIPEDIEIESDRYVSIPHKNDLELGRNLVFAFSSQFLEEEVDEVYNIFSRSGAYRNFKDLLESKGLLESWYSFEDEHTKSALLNWCNENGINVSA